MSTINSIPFRSTIFYRNDGTVAPLGTVLTIGINNTMSTTNSLSIDTLTASTITVSKLNLASTVISLGQSTNQTYNNFSNGSYLTWVTAKSALSGTNKTVMSANGLYQMIVGNTTSGLFLSSDSGITWTSLTGGLPVLTGSAYWSDGTISANGQYITLSIYGGSLWMSADYGRTFALTNQPTPSIWLPLNGSVADSMGLSVVTTPGTVPGYVTLNYPGYTAQAVNLLNTAGGTATRYITGTWTGSPSGNFTVSGWFNPQSLTGVYQVIFSTYSNYCAILINPSNQLIAIVPSGGGLNYVNVGVSSTLVINTWYYFSLSFQTNGTCSFYLNNTLLGSITNTQGVASLTTSVFELSGYEGSQAVAFNGFMDDFRITNSVSTYVPIPLLQPNIWMPFENTTSDLGSNAITPTVVGSLSYVPGVVGLNAVNLVNPPGGTPANYIYGSWPALTVCTISGWFNIQSFSTTANQFICSLAAATGSIIVFIDFTSRKLSTQLGISQASIGNALSLNTWYYFQLIVPSSSSATLYLNSDSVTFAYTAGTSAGGGFSVGTYSGGGYAFNGYVDDLRIYNADVGYHTLLPQNYRALALSGTGQYALAAAASGWVVGSSDLLKTWSKRAVCVGTQGDIIQPNKTGLVQSTWEQNGVNWTSSISSQLGGTPYPYFPFQNTNDGNIWISAGNYSSGVYNNTYLTTVLSIGTVYGEWLQIQSSIPLVITSYTFQVYNAGNLPKSYYIVGSSDGTTWYPIQSCVLATNPITTTNVKCSNNLLVNFNGTQTLTGNVSSAVTTIAYTYATTPYTYFRIIVTGLFSTATYAEIGEWYVNFARSSTATLSLNHTGQYQLVATGPAAGSVMPNQTGLSTYTWSQGGVNWGASSSTELSGYYSYYLFNNLASSNSWANSLANYTSSGNTSGITTVIQGGIGTVTGDWIQIQSSVPLVMSSYQFGTGGGNTQFPKTYYIVGSNDGSTWYPIQFGSGAAAPTPATAIISGTIIVNSTSTQTFGASTISTTAYSTSTNAYTYFRLIGLNIYYPSGTAYLEISEWLINFQNSVSYSANYGATWLNTSPTVSNESVALSPSGQYALSTNSVSPFARLTLDNTAVDTYGILVPTTGGTAPTYSTSIKAVGTHSAQFANTAGGTPSVYLNYTVPTALNTPSALTMACWVYPSTYGVASNSYILNLGSTTQYGCALGFNAAGEIFSYTGKTSGGAQQTMGAGVAPLNTWTHVAMTYNANLITLYVNGVVSAQSAISGNLSLVGGGNITNLLVGCSLVLQALNGYVDDVRIYTSALSATAISTLYNNPTITLSQIVAVSNSYLPITSYTFPALAGIGTATVVDTAVSQTGQYMVAVTSSTTNNVYYSTDYGATFTALTVGSSAMVSCSISYDGSYITVTNTTTTYTLNKNTRGFTLAIGNQAGRINQGLNAIAIGDKAGQTNQSNNSIVLNATGVALDAVAPGFYVAPVASAASSSAAPFNLLGYGTDNQVVQSSALTVLQNGNMGIGATNPVTILDIRTTNLNLAYGVNQNERVSMIINQGGSGVFNGTFGGYMESGVNYGVSHYLALGTVAWTGTVSTFDERIRILGTGNVGIGITNPVGLLSVALDGTGVYNPGIWNGSYVLFGPGAGATNGSAVAITYNTVGLYGVLICLTAGQAWRDMYYSANQHVFFTAGSATERMRINTAGFIGIGVASPSFQLHLSTDSAAKPSTNTWSVSSDERLKENIILADVDRCIEIIRAIPLKHYRWKDEVYTLEQVKDRSKLGWIAQDVEKVFPKAVGTNVFRYNQVYEDVVKEDGTTEKRLISEDVIEDCRDLNADQLYAVMYGAIQKLISENDLYKTTNIAINEQFAALQARMDALEALLTKSS